MNRTPDRHTAIRNDGCPEQASLPGPHAAARQALLIPVLLTGLCLTAPGTGNSWPPADLPDKEAFPNPSLSLPLRELRKAFEADDNHAGFTLFHNLEGPALDQDSLVFTIKETPATSAVDLRPYLQPGTNCLAFYGWREDCPPFLYFNAQVIMDSGAAFTWQTGPDWLWSPNRTPGWTKAGFNADAWQPVNSGRHHARGRRHGYDGHVLVAADKGRIELRNADGRDLFFRDDRPIRLEVRLPPRVP